VSLLLTAGRTPEVQAVTLSQAIDKIIAKEHQLIDLMQNLTPLVETYIQILRPDPRLGVVPIEDEYFLGRLEREHGISETLYVGKHVSSQRIPTAFKIHDRAKFNPLGFTRMIFPDGEDFDRTHYDFRFLRREFLGDVRCLVMDVLPKPGAGHGRFLGRIWVEDQDYTIVRFNGSLTNHPKFKDSVHLDSWRLNFFPKVWLPAYVYSEDSVSHALHYKAQTRLWAYDLQHAGDHHEFEQKMADTAIPVDHIDSGVELSPILSERPTQYSGEEDSIERLQVAGLVAPDGELDRILETVAQNLVLPNAVQSLSDVRCRVLLTLPVDSFSIGHTIFVSRGLLDVVPDEATLALVLAHELGHIILGHSVSAESELNDRPFLSNENLIGVLSFRPDETEERSADKKSLELFAGSPYRQELDSPRRFLQELEMRSLQLPNLIRPHLRNRVPAGKNPATLGQSGGRLGSQRIAQAALPLGSRIKLNPWSNRIELIQPALVPVPLAREAMPLGITPFHPYLRRSSLAIVAETVQAH
jgi:hypothetical protein